LTEVLSAMTGPLRESLRSGRSVAHQDSVFAVLSASYSKEFHAHSGFSFTSA